MYATAPNAIALAIIAETLERAQDKPSILIHPFYLIHPGFPWPRISWATNYF